jgi:hypothetical protein
MFFSFWISESGILTRFGAALRTALAGFPLSSRAGKPAFFTKVDVTHLLSGCVFR